MIHFATVHWADPRWIEVQLDYLARHVSGPYRTWAFVGRIPDRERWTARFDHAFTARIRPHAWKLNLLGNLISQTAEPDDLLVFIDADAFPIAPLDEYLRERLAERPLVAVRRDENNGDRQPHPCFCATTAGFWRRIDGDWRRGGTWADARGERVTDVGGNLLHILADRGAEWHPMLRSNRRDLHPLMFGVYEDLVYHHGGGSRPMAGGRLWLAEKGEELAASRLARALDRLPRRGPLRTLRRRAHPRRRYKERLVAEIAAVSERVFEELEADPEFHRAFLDPDYDGPLAELRAPVVI